MANLFIRFIFVPHGRHFIFRFDFVHNCGHFIFIKMAPIGAIFISAVLIGLHFYLQSVYGRLWVEINSCALKGNVPRGSDFNIFLRVNFKMHTWFLLNDESADFHFRCDSVMPPEI